MSGFLAPRSGDILDNVQGNLELKWCAWPGDWETFVVAVNKDGTPMEKKVIAQFPEEFRSRAIEKASRLSNWQENRLYSLLQKMEELTQAEKVDPKTGETSADNPVRYQATKFLLERTLGKTPETSVAMSATGQELNNKVERREYLRRILDERGTAIEEQGTVEIRPADPEEIGKGQPGSDPV